MEGNARMVYSAIPRNFFRHLTTTKRRCTNVLSRPLKVDSSRSTWNTGMAIQAHLCPFVAGSINEICCFHPQFSKTKPTVLGEIQFAWLHRRKKHWRIHGGCLINALFHQIKTGSFLPHLMKIQMTDRYFRHLRHFGCFYLAQNSMDFNVAPSIYSYPSW